MKKSKLNIKIIALTTISCYKNFFYYDYFLETFNNNKNFFTKKIKKQILRKGF